MSATITVPTTFAAELLPLTAASKALGMSPPTLRKHIRAGTIPAHRVGPRFRVNLGEALAATRLEQAAGSTPTKEQATKAKAVRLEAVKRQVLGKLRHAGGVPECGLCQAPISSKGLVLFDPEDERTKQTYLEDPWFVHSPCYFSGWARHKSDQGLHYKTLPLPPLQEQLKANSYRIGSALSNHRLPVQEAKAS